MPWLLPAVVALLIVAGVGWLDDKSGLSAPLRFGAHCLAALVLLAFYQPWTLLQGDPVMPLNIVVALGVCVIVLLAIVWSINLHNFMDGINGLLASQAIFVLAVAAAMIALYVGLPLAIPALIAVAAIAGFLPFNFPRARIFMGDVGSGALGLLVAIAVLAMLAIPTLDPALGLIACSAFVTDATATLLSRMLRGRRWYSAHREHLYQSLVRSGYSHAQVVGFYMGWNVIIVLPAIVAIQSNPRLLSAGGLPFSVSILGLAVLALIYALAVVTWTMGKRYCLAKVRAGRSSGIA